MIKWEALNRPKEFDGLGFLDVRVMNICLMAKWIDKLERGDNSLCCSILRNKYLGQKSIFQIKRRQGSQFWRSLLDIRDWYQRGRKVTIRGGHQTRFWLDCWLGDCPLNVMFNNLFQIATKPDIEVFEVFENGQWQIQFRRQLNGILRDEWIQLQTMLSEVTLTEERDVVVWALEKSGKYSTNSLYRLMTFGGIRDIQMMRI